MHGLCLEMIIISQPLISLIQLSVSQKDEKSDSFVEKLSMQIVKNLQVHMHVSECYNLSWQLHMFLSCNGGNNLSWFKGG